MGLRSRGGPSDFFDFGPAEQAGRKEDQHDDQDRERGDVLVFDREVGRPQRLDQSDGEAAEHCAGQRADAAEDCGGERLDAGDKAHEEIDEAVIEQVHHAGDGGERSADHEGHGDGAVDIDAEQRRHGLVLLAGAHVAAEPGARYQPGEQREQHDGGDDDDDLDVGQLHDEAACAFMQRVAAGDDRRHRLDARALRDLRIIGQHERHADRREHRREAERMPQRPVGDALDRPAIERGDRHRDQQHDQQDQRGSRSGRTRPGSGR